MDSSVFTYNPADKKGAIAEMLYPISVVTVLPGSSPHANSLPYGIKLFALVAASGHYAPPVLIFQDKGMKEDDFNVQTTMLLGGGNNKRFGYVVFCKSRCPNTNFYEWYNNEVLIPFIQDQREVHKLPKETEAWYQLDGERIQIKCYFEYDMVEKLKENNVTVGKPPASTTSITQPLDVGNCFLAAKLNSEI